jgi:hypothetical protein
MIDAADLIEQQAARLTALESERDALLAAAGKEAVIPDGWKLVPIKPTVEIVKAGGKARVDDFNRNGTTLSPKDANRVAEAMYRAMIEAAPTAALENGDGRDAERWRWFVANYGALTLHEKFSDNVPRVFTHELKGRSWDEITQAIDAAMSQKAGEQQ